MTEFAPDTLENLELGAKSEFADLRPRSAEPAPIGPPPVTGDVFDRRFHRGGKLGSERLDLQIQRGLNVRIVRLTCSGCA